MRNFSEPVLYKVLKIDGDYAWLRKYDSPTSEPVMVALALLPQGITEGCKLNRVLFEYTLA